MGNPWPVSLRFPSHPLHEQEPTMNTEHFDPEAVLAELRIRLDEAGRFL